MSLCTDKSLCVEVPWLHVGVNILNNLCLVQQLGGVEWNAVIW